MAVNIVHKSNHIEEGLHIQDSFSKLSDWSTFYNSEGGKQKTL